MKIIFLDIDGVLNHRAVFTPKTGPAVLCPKAVARFRRLVERSGAKVVLSSTWRLGDPSTCRYIAKLRSAGVLDHAHEDWRTVRLPWPLGASIAIDGPCRGDEIAEWLSRHPEITAYVIIDDDSDMLREQMPSFVKTTFENGLLDGHCQVAEAILSRSRIGKRG